MILNRFKAPVYTSLNRVYSNIMNCITICTLSILTFLPKVIEPFVSKETKYALHRLILGAVYTKPQTVPDCLFLRQPIICYHDNLLIARF